MGERIHTAKWMVKSEDQRAKKRLSHFVFPKKPKKHMTFLISCKARSKKLPTEKVSFLVSREFFELQRMRPPPERLKVNGRQKPSEAAVAYILR